MREPMGTNDQGWTACHGCGAIVTVKHEITHAPDCPGLCVKPDCHQHPKV